MPSELDAQIEAAAEAGGMTYSAWLAAAARKEFLIREGLEGVAAFEREHGPFTDAELTEANAWAEEVIRKARGSGGRSRRTA